MNMTGRDEKSREAGGGDIWSFNTDRELERVLCAILSLSPVVVEVWPSI